MSYLSINFMKNFSICSFVSTLLVGIGLAGNTTVPSDLETNIFAGPDITPCPAVICAAPTGEVFVGVDKQGSLGKKSNLGEIVRLVDTNNDGKADKHTVFAKVDNPRGLISIGDKIYCLHCTQDADGKIYTQQLSVFVDADNDGVADGAAKPLVTDIGNPIYLKSRGTDHSTNNIRLGIDGWIYISVGDFGFIDAAGTDGKKLSMHGGGIVRVRPDGSELETFIHGTRNVYDVAIDPFMNVFTRENTNDGVGWWVRFSHYMQSGEYGYPSLYTNFPEDMIPALGEYGSGSGTGNLFFQEPGWPAKYNNTAMMADWGTSQIYIHRLSPDGSSFTNKPEGFIRSSQVADLDVDGSGRMYIAAWDGAGYSGNPNKGFVSIVKPKGWTYKAFPDLKALSAKDLVASIISESATMRTYAQQEILRRNDKSMLANLQQITTHNGASLESKAAAIYTLAQLGGKDSQAALAEISKADELREHAIRCMADRKELAQSADLALVIKALDDKNPRVQVAAAVALGRIGDKSAAPALIAKANPPKVIKQSAKPEFQSKKITGTESVQIDVNINQFTELFLIANAGENDGSDHIAWINPKITMKNGKVKDLTKMKWQKASQSWGKTLINKDCTGKALKDSKGNAETGIGSHAKSMISYRLPKGAVRFTATARLTNPKGTVSFSVSKNPPGGAGKTHSTPNSAILLPHIARQALIALNAEDALIKALNSGDLNQEQAALAVMKFMHSDKIVDALIAAAGKDSELKYPIALTLVRLHQKEIDYDGSTWWNTRPKPEGPYYYPVDWSSTDKISAFITDYYKTLPEPAKIPFRNNLQLNKSYVPELNPRPIEKEETVKKMKDISIEDVVLHVNSKKSKTKGGIKRGAKIITKVGCVSCHNTNLNEPVKGPDLAKLGLAKRGDIAEAIIKPSASIAPSWVNITMQDGSVQLGTIVSKDAKEIVLHNIAGIPTKLDATKVKSIAPGPDMMSHHLCDKLTLKEFSDLLSYIQSMDKRAKK